MLFMGQHTLLVMVLLHGKMVAAQDILVILFFHRVKFKILEEDFLKEILVVDYSR